MQHDDTDDVVDALTRTGRRREEPIPNEDLLKTGSTVLDLALSGRRAGGFPKGRYIWMVGDSSSGKTFLMLTCLAEASINPEFDDYRFIYDNAEDGALMNLERYFGRRMAARLEPPAGSLGGPVFSEQIEDFYYHLDDAFIAAEAPGGKPFIYLLDSMDSLDSKYAKAKFDEAKKASRKGTKAKGDYGDGKAKMNSTRIRQVLARLRATGSILIILSQTRDNINAGLYEETKTHAGGHALKFYACVQLWSSVGSKIKRTIAEKDVQIGVRCRVQTKKNRIAGKNRTVEFPIYYDTGIDDIGGMVDFLTGWKVWPKKRGGLVDASGDFEGVIKRREDLIKWLEDNEMRGDLEEITEEAWRDIETRAAVKRKVKYDA